MNLACHLIEKHLADNFLAGQFNSQLLQSSGWSDFQNATGKRSWHLGVTSSNQLVAVAMVLEQTIISSLTYLYCPRGPIVDATLTTNEKNEVIKLILGQLREITVATSNKDEVYAKLEPTLIAKAMEEVCLKGNDIQPANTLLINLHSSQEQLLDSFHSKTRYNIKVAQKHNLQVSLLSASEFDQVWPLFNQTSERGQFRLHNKNYYQLMLTYLATAQLWVTKNSDGQIIACAITAHFGDTITYLHGASDHAARALMAPYLLHWEIINHARKQGWRWYDLHGIAPADQPRHPLNNVSKFKLGWGGQRVIYPGAYDLVYSPGLYHGYNFAKKIIRRLRKLF